MNIRLASEGKHYHLTMVMFVLFIAFYVLQGKVPPIPNQPVHESGKWPMMYMPFLGYITLDRTKSHLVVGWHRIMPTQSGANLIDGRFTAANV